MKLSTPDSVIHQARSLVGLKVARVERKLAFSIDLYFVPVEEPGQEVILWIKEAGWRIEENHRIVCGCYDKDAKKHAEALLAGTLVESVSAKRRDIKLSMSLGRTLWLLQRSSTLADWLVNCDGHWFHVGPGDACGYDEE